MTKRTHHLVQRMRRRSRRLLAAFLMLGAGLAASGSLHAHDLISEDRRGSEPTSAAEDWECEESFYEDCFLSESCSRPTESYRPAGEKKIAKAPEASGRARTGTDAVEKSDGQAGLEGRNGEAVEPVVNRTGERLAEYLRLRGWMALGGRSQSWVSPLLAAGGPGEGFTLAWPATEHEAFSPLDAAADSAGAPLADSLTRDLSDLTCEEPVDVEDGSKLTFAGPDTSDTSDAAVNALAAQPPQFGAAARVGAGPMIVTLPEAYLSYDLSPEDAIAMRLYPISRNQSPYLAARRTGLYAPVDPVGVQALAGSDAAAPSAWKQVIEPARRFALSSESKSAAVEMPLEAARLGRLALTAIDAIQPGSGLREQLQPNRLGGHWGELSTKGVDKAARIAELTLGDLAMQLAAAKGADAPAPPPAILLAEDRADLPSLRGRPSLPAQALWNPAEILEAALASSSVTRAPGLPLDLACRTAIDVVRAQAARPDAESIAHGVSAPRALRPVELTRAEALATACDKTAAGLEQLARFLRRAGDTAVRQARQQGGLDDVLIR